MIPVSWKNEILPVVVAVIFLGIAAVFVVSLAQTPGRSEGTEEDFRAAAELTRRPSPAFVSHALVRVKFDQPVLLATFTYAGQVDEYKKPSAFKDIWVTVVPYTRAFCQEYERLTNADDRQLNLRLNELLGLPPDKKYDRFVELTVDPKDKGANLIRPCGNSPLDAETCGPPEFPASESAYSNQPASTPFQEWMLRKYRENYTAESPYPWTALGYTFDWAPRGDSDDFQRYGESEFVIPKDSPIHYVNKFSTKDYCTPH
jgi:hypothetical protein